MSFLRWIPTFLAFPLGGLTAMLLLGGSTGPLVALLGGAIVGAAVGGAQWLALGRRAGLRWFVATVSATSLGSALASVIAGSPTTTSGAVLTGLVLGSAVGIAQASVLGAGLRAGVVWAATVAASWTVGWFITAQVIVDLDRGHFVFGSSGALVVTVVTGVVLRLLLGPRGRRAQDVAADGGDASTTAVVRTEA